MELMEHYTDIHFSGFSMLGTNFNLLREDSSWQR